MREIAIVTRGGEVTMIGGGSSRLSRLLTEDCKSTAHLKRCVVFLIVLALHEHAVAEELAGLIRRHVAVSTHRVRILDGTTRD